MKEFLKDTLKSLRNDYGGPIDYLRIDSSGFDPDTGEINPVKNEYHIRKAIRLPNSFEPDKIFKGFGAIFDIGTRVFIVLGKDLPVEPKKQDKIIAEDKEYTVFEYTVLDYKLGYLLRCKSSEEGLTYA